MNVDLVTSVESFGQSGASRGRLLTLIILGNLLLSIDRPLVAALLEPIRHDLKLTDTQLGLLTGLAYSGATVLVMIPIGVIADRFSRKVVLTSAVALLSVFTALCGAAGSYIALLVARMGIGAAGPASPVVGLSMIADAFPKERQSGATGIFYSISGLGALVSFSAGGWIAQHYGWRTALLAAGALGVIAVPLLLIFLVDPPRGGSLEKIETIGFRPALVSVAKNNRLVWLLVTNAFGYLGAVALIGWSTSLLIRNHGMALSQAGTIVAIATGILTPLGQFSGGRIGDRLAIKHPGAPMWFSGASCAFGAAFGVVAALTPITPLAVAALLAASFCSLMNMGPILALMMQLAPAQARTTVFAILSVLGNLISWGGGPLVVGSLSDLIGGPHSLSYAIAITMALTLVPAAMFIRLGNCLAVCTTGR